VTKIAAGVAAGISQHGYSTYITNNLSRMAAITTREIWKPCA